MNCDCFYSSRLELNIFSIASVDKNKIPDSECPICLDSLNETSKNSCCSGYARRLKNCGHYVHVSCQLNKNPDLRRCPVCREVQADHNIYLMIITRMFASKLQSERFEELKKKEPMSYEEGEGENLKKFAKDTEAVKANFMTMYENQNNPEELEKLFKRLCFK